MQSVALVRNLNQGQRGHSSTADLLAAFADAGCLDAASFQSNGTIVFEAADPDAVVEQAMSALAARSGVVRDGFAMSFAQLADIVGPYAAAPNASRHELTLHSGGAIEVDDPQVVREATRRRCRIVDAGKGWAMSVNERDHESNATPVVERIVGTPATSRGVPTLLRLLERFTARP